jgi:hypothetical protein
MYMLHKIDDWTDGTLLRVSTTISIPVTLLRNIFGGVVYEILLGRFKDAASFFDKIGFHLLVDLTHLIDKGSLSETLAPFLSPGNKSLFNPTVTVINNEESFAFAWIGEQIFLSTVKQVSTLLSLSSKRLGSLPDSGLVCLGVSAETLEKVKMSLNEYLPHFWETFFTYISLSAELVRIQAIICSSLISITGNVEDIGDHYSEYISSVLPEELWQHLVEAKMLENFVMTMIYPNVLRGDVHEFRKFLCWLNDLLKVKKLKKREESSLSQGR